MFCSFIGQGDEGNDPFRLLPLVAATFPKGTAEPSQALPRQLPRRGSQAVRLVAEVLGAMRNLPAVAKKLPLRGSWHRAAMTERVQPACAKQKLSRSAALSQKAALHLPFPSTTPPVKRGFRKARRLF